MTTFLDFAIQAPGRAALTCLEERIEEAQGSSVIDFGFHAGLTDPRPATSAEVSSIISAGVSSFKFFMTYKRWGFYVDLGFLYGAMLEISRRSGVAMVHAEDDELLEASRPTARDDIADYGRNRPELAEEVAIRDAITVAMSAGAALYVVHLSTGNGLRAIIEARGRGATVVAETCPHYLAFTDEAYSRPDGRLFTMTPPLRAPGNREVLWRGVIDGDVDVLASDHNSFTRSQKEAPASTFDVPPGLGGSEMLLPFVLSEGVNQGRISLERAVELLSARPAAIFSLPSKGAIEIGRDADLVILDLEQRRVIADGTLHDPQAYSCFAGQTIRGWPILTISRGEVIVEGDQCVAPAGRGQFIRRLPPRARGQ